jgi:toxin ParE1/3/4
MKYRVHLVREAEEDLLGILRYVALSGSPENAGRLLNQIEQAIMNLETMPERGHTPPELKRINVQEYREIHLKVYRIIYQIIGPDVFVHCVLDGRRDIQDLLHERLLRPPQLI